MKRLNELTSNEINRITHLYANGYTDINMLAKRFDLEPEDVENLTKEVKIWRNKKPKFEPGDKLVLTVSEKSTQTGGGFEYQFEELPELWFKAEFVENNLIKIGENNGN